MSNQKFNQYNVFQNENESNSMMTALANRLINVRSKGLQNILSDFDGSEHKLEFVKNIKGMILSTIRVLQIPMPFGTPSKR